MPSHLRDRASGRRDGSATLPLSKVTWKLVEQVFAKWVEDLDPMTSLPVRIDAVEGHRAREASGLDPIEPVRGRSASEGPDAPTRCADDRATCAGAVRRAKAADFTLYAYVMGMATIGCRRSELLAHHGGDLDLEHGFVTIRASIADGGPGRGIYRKTTKRDDWRDVPLTEQMVAVFRELLDRRRDLLAELGTSVIDSGRLRVQRRPGGATWLRPDSTSQRWLAARGDSTVTFAMLRRFVATQLLDVTSGDYRTVASITGNSEETLRRWYDAGPNLEKKRAVVKLSRL